MRILPLLSLTACLLFHTAPGVAADLRIKVAGIEDQKGQVRVALFTSAEDFAADRQQAGYFELVAGGSIEVVFTGLAPGRYGITLFHDENGNEKLDTNLVGLPTEPFGFSRDARGSFGPPKFDDFALEIGTENVAVEISLQ